jgi:ABC-2 type transport system ATP-binding protein
MYDIEVDGVTKRFESTIAVDDVSLRVERGELFGLLGPNGAGKSTLTKMVSGMMNPSSGGIKISGYNIQENSMKVKELMGVIPQDIVLYSYMNAFENLAFFGRLYGLSGRHLRERMDRMVEFTQLDEKATRRRISTYSGGMKRRVNIAVALLHEPQVILMDEPTAGLDPQNRLALWDIIRTLHQQGKTIVLTTHLMDEAEELCDRVAIMDKGKIIALDTPHHLIDKINIEHTITVVPDRITDKEVGALEKVSGIRSVNKLRDADDETEKLGIIAEHPEAALPEVVAAILSVGRKIRSIELSRVTLEDVFIAMTGRYLRQEEE